MRMHRVPHSCSRLPRARSTTAPPATFTHSAVRGCCHQRCRTHHKFKSPHIASIVQSVIAAIIIILFALLTGSNDPASQAYLQLYGLMAVMGVIIILSVQALVSLAILIYYERYHRDEVHWWKTRLAPILALISQAFVVYLLFANISFLGSG